MRLVGDIKGDFHQESTESQDAFLLELEQLMLRHKVDKIDVGWRRPGSTIGHGPRAILTLAPRPA